MARLAKTMPSNARCAWQEPSGVQLPNVRFGIPVPGANLQYGLEEFNLTCFYRKHRLAFVPCVRAGNFPPDEDVLHLFHQVEGNKFHYATLQGVRAITPGGQRAGIQALLAQNINCIFQEFSNSVGLGVSPFNAADLAWIQEDYVGRLAAPVFAGGVNASFPVTCTYERLELAQPNAVTNANAFLFGGRMANVCFINFPALAPLPPAAPPAECCQ